MASIVEYNGRGKKGVVVLRRIEFSLTPSGPRKIVRLGPVTLTVAKGWRDKIESIISDRLANRPHDAELAKWLGGLPETMLGRMREAGLAEGVGLAEITLGDFLKRFLDLLSCKPATRICYSNVRRNLEEFFGPGRLLRNVTPADADAWRAWLVQHEKPKDGKRVVVRLSAPTVSRRVIAARTMWKKAIRWKFVTDSPFAGVKAGQQVNESRKRFITRETIEKAIAEAPDAEWKAIIALARYGGLRVPSELFALRWADVDFETGRMKVRSPKTEHHEGGAWRMVPLFIELRPHLDKLFTESAVDGAVYVISKHRLPGMNLRTEFGRILDRARLEEWPKLFHNLRASWESELMREYDLATVCKWIGNSPAVAAKHYATSVDLDSDFRRAAGLGPAQYRAQQSVRVSGDSSCQDETTNNSANEKSPENSGDGDSSRELSNAGKAGGWAIQAPNVSQKCPKSETFLQSAAQIPAQLTMIWALRALWPL